MPPPTVTNGTSRSGIPAAATASSVHRSAAASSGPTVPTARVGAAAVQVTLHLRYAGRPEPRASPAHAGLGRQGGRCSGAAPGWPAAPSLSDRAVAPPLSPAGLSAVGLRESAEGGFGLPREVRVRFTGPAVEHRDDAEAGEVEVVAGVPVRPVREVVQREGEHEGTVDALGVEDLQQFPQVCGLAGLVPV